MNRSQSLSKWLLIPLAAAGISYLFNVGGYPLMDPDEGRNAGIAQAMAEENAYLVPRHNTLPYVDKPVLYFAVTGLVMEVLGPAPFSARLSSLAFTLATLLLIGWFGSRLFDRATGWTAVLITAASPLTLAFSRTVIFDSTLTFFVLAAIVGFHVAVEADPDADRRYLAVLVAWVAMALGVLTKGPIALGLPLFIMLPFAWYRRRTRRLFDALGVLAFVAVILPWLLVMSNAAPGYLRYAIVTETINRFATDELRRAGPWWYFLPILLAGAAPWSLVVCGHAVSRARRFIADAERDPRAVLLLAWILVPLLFFSLSQSKRVQYVLPLIPAFGLAAAWIMQHMRLHRIVRAVCAGLLGVIAVVLLASPSIVPNLVETTTEIRAAIPFVATVLGGATLLASVALVKEWGDRHEIRTACLALPTLLIPFITIQLMSAIGHNRSAQGLAAAIENVTTESAEIVGVHAYPPSLGFYLQKPVTLSTDDGRELTSNYIVEFFDEWSTRSNHLESGDWWLERLTTCDTPAAFVVRRDDAPRQLVLAESLPLIGLDRKYAAYGPCIPGSLARPTP